MFAESNDDDYLPGCCPGCQLPWTSCICSTPWSEWVSPAYYFALESMTVPAAWWQRGPMPSEALEDIKVRMQDIQVRMQT